MNMIIPFLLFSLLLTPGLTNTEREKRLDVGLPDSNSTSHLSANFFDVSKACSCSSLQIGNNVSSTSKQDTKRVKHKQKKTPANLVYFFVKGSTCEHCMDQLIVMASSLSKSGLDVTVVSSESFEDLARFPKTPFKLISDPEKRLFEKYGVVRDGQTMHGTVVTNGSGKTLFKTVGDEPFMDSGRLLKVSRQLPEIQVLYEAQKQPRTTMSPGHRHVVKSSSRNRTRKI